MDHLSEVIKILESALQHNVRKAADYAGLLADKLEKDGENRQANMIRQKLAKIPAQTLSPTNLNAILPVDSESQLHTVDEELPQVADIQLTLPNNAEARIYEFIESVRATDKLAKAGLHHPSRLMLYGPPGCGKTQAAKLIAAELQIPILTIRCDTLISSLLGQTSRNLRRVFEHAENRPCVLFLDELDALAKTRTAERDVGELQRIVIALLQNIDALSNETILLAATNHEDLLDHAVWRRFAWNINLSLPDKDLREKIWKLKFKSFAPKDLKFETLAELSEGLSGATIEHVAHDSIRAAIIKGEDHVMSLDVLRRLGLTIAMMQGININSKDKEIEFLRQWAPHRLALRKLAEYYGISVRQTNKAAKGKMNGSSTRSPDPIS